MSDTPRTDARLGYGNEHHGANMLCRELERELNQAIRERNRFKECDEAVGALHRLMSDAGIECGHIVDRVERVVIQRDENKAGWDRASLTALDLEQRLKRAEKCISAIETHYKSKHGEERYAASTMASLISEWRGPVK